MAGHSKWANIKHKKERADKQKGKIFSRLAKEIISAVKMGGPDPKNNPRLRLAIQKAKEANMPNDNVERNIKKASSDDQSDYESVTYEIYGHGGVGIIVEAMTDNKNRTASDMRIATNKRGGNIAQPGAVAFNFDSKGVIQVEKGKMKEETLFNAAIEAGAEDFEAAEEGYMITTDPAELYAVKEKLDEKQIPATEADIERLPKTLIDCDEETRAANLALIDWLEELEDVNAVYHNMDL
ncbi:MAG: YebC/PmpR family DNA-binding transcriptional regulator [Chlamydiales bacterium]|nr:YebC/PmpR family DNA-binding transcriptional regulator [Chlamydiales bacterium]